MRWRKRSSRSCSALGRNSTRYALLGPQVGENLFCWPSLATLALMYGFVDSGFRVPELLFVHLTFFVVEIEIERLLYKSVGSSNVATLDLLGNALLKFLAEGDVHR